MTRKKKQPTGLDSWLPEKGAKRFWPTREELESRQRLEDLTVEVLRVFKVMSFKDRLRWIFTGEFRDNLHFSLLDELVYTGKGKDPRDTKK